MAAATWRRVGFAVLAGLLALAVWQAATRLAGRPATPPAEDADTRISRLYAQATESEQQMRQAQTQNTEMGARTRPERILGANPWERQRVRAGESADPAEATFPSLVTEDRLEQMFLAKVGPENIGHPHLRVGGLPEKKIGDPEFPTGAEIV